MSSFAYGRLVRQQELPIAGSRDAAAAKAEENKLVTAVAALIPTEIVALHGLILSVTTSTQPDGSTTIANPEPLKWSLFVLIGLAVVVYLIGRGFKEWKRVDFLRVFIPPFAVVVWTGIVGTSALTPWVVGLSIYPTWVVIGAGLLGVLLVAVSARINPPKAK
jgi:hypothetical protein